MSGKDEDVGRVIGRVLPDIRDKDEHVGGKWRSIVQTLIDWTSVLFVVAEFRTITSNPIFEGNALYWFLEDTLTHGVQ